MIIKTSLFSPKLSTVTKKDVKIKYSRHSEQWNPICRPFQAKQDPHTSIIYRNQLFLRTKYRCKIGRYMHTKRGSTIISSSLARQEQRMTRRFRPWNIYKIVPRKNAGKNHLKVSNFYLNFLCKIFIEKIK